MGLAIGNFVILIIWVAIFGSKTYELDLKKHPQHHEAYCLLLRIKLDNQTNSEVAHANYERVNILIAQLQGCIKWYSVTLAPVYIAFTAECIIKKYWGNDLYEVFHPYLKAPQDIFNLLSAVFLYLGFTVLYDQTLDEKNRLKRSSFSFPFTTRPDKTAKYRFYFPPTVIILFLGFLLGYSVFFLSSFSSTKADLSEATISNLYAISSNYENTANIQANSFIGNIDTIIKEYKGNSNQNDNASQTNANRKKGKPDESSTNRSNVNFNTVVNRNANTPVSGVNSLDKIGQEANLFQANVKKRATKDVREAIDTYTKATVHIVPNLFGLFIGCVNALAMFLLFSRYISMEHMINNTKAGKPYTWITIGTIYLLPIYALVQPLFGSFEINAFGDKFAFANYVFLVCLFGKAFFLYFTWRYMSKRLMHFYLHSVVSFHGIPSELGTCFEGEFKPTDRKEDVN